MKKISLLVFLVCFAVNLIAQERPKIGLVLSGGGARGAAHIGVLKYLEEQRIPIDVIAGTSMGAIVGGLYASGLSADEIAEITILMDWSQKLTDNVPRSERSIQRKRLEDTFSVPGTPGFKDMKLALPSGAIQGQNITLELQRITQHVSHITNFDDLPIPFRAVATDIVSGEMVELKSGNLGKAMRASMGVPAVFAPIVIDGRHLVDGGVTNNLPIDIARSMGADVLIIVDIGTPLLDKEGIVNILSVTDQLTRMLITSNAQRQIATMTQDDLLLLPDLGEFSSTDFDSAAIAIDIGYSNAIENAVGLSEFAHWQDEYVGQTAAALTTHKISSLEINNTSGLNDAVLANLITVEPGDDLDRNELKQQVSTIHSLGNFELVDYSLRHHPNSDLVGVNITAKRKSWGPDYLHFGLNVESEFENDLRAQVLLGYTKEEMTDTGAEWTTYLGIGDEPVLYTDWYQPLTYTRDWYIYGITGYEEEIVSIFDGASKIAEIGLETVSAYMAIGYEFGSSANVQIGFLRAKGKSDTSIGNSSLPDVDYSEGGFELGFLYDTRDDIDFPSSGYTLQAIARTVNPDFGGNSNYDLWEIQTAKYHAWGPHNFGILGNIGGSTGTNNAGSVFRLGGYGQITGIRSDQLIGNYKGIVSGIYYRRFDGLPAVDGFIGTIVEYGGAWQSTDDISTDTSILSAGAFIGADTPLGTMQLGFAITDDGDSTVFTRIGRVF